MSKPDRDFFILLGIFSVGLCLAILVNREPAHQARPLSAWLRDLSADDAGKRDDAQKALRQMGVKVLPHLLARIEAADTNIQTRGILGFTALGSVAMPATQALAVLLSKNETSLPAARALAAIGPASIPVLTNSLSSPVRFVRTSGARGLGRMGRDARPAVPALVGALDDDDDDLRYFAARALGHIAEEPDLTVPALAARLEDRSVEVRKMAAHSLGQFRQRAQLAVPALLQAMQGNDSGVKLTALFALKEIDPEAAATAGVK